VKDKAPATKVAPENAFSSTGIVETRKSVLSVLRLKAYPNHRVVFDKVRQYTVLVR